MNLKRNIPLFIILSTLSSCIEPFSPSLGNQSTAKYEINGVITDQEGYQTVSVSMTSTFENPNYSPLSFCDVKILDNNGHVFQLTESTGGEYKAWIEKEYLVPGNSYQVKVITPSGVEIISDLEKMTECANVDSVYFIRKDMPTTDPNSPLKGIQFYIDLKGKDTDSRYYRWEVEETWEHHAVYPKTIYVKQFGGIDTCFPPDYSRFICWTTQKLKNIFTLSTDNIGQNKATMQPLNFVDNQTQRLKYGYSLMIHQFTLSEAAFKFWDNLRINSSKQSGLINSQPLRVKGNLKSTTNPELDILGYFSASSVKTKRIFVRNVDNLEVPDPTCIPPRLPTPRDSGVKYYLSIDGVLYVIESTCVECDYKDGVTLKPDFWP